MADKRFNITITAIDRSTAAIKKVNESFSKLVRPITDINRAAKTFSKEAGLDKISKSMMNIGRAAGDVAGKLTSIVTPLGAITSVGSIAGMAAMETAWAKLGFEVSRTSQTLGLSTSQLQSLRGAGTMAGVSVESLTSGLKSLGDTMQDALYGRNQQALVMMNQLGIRMKKTKSGAVDTAQAFYDLADAIKSQKSPQVQSLIARTFGLEDSLPLLRQGSKAVKDFEEQWKKTGAVMTPQQADTAGKLYTSLMLLGGALQGVGNHIALVVAKFQPWIDSLTKAITAHQNLAAIIGSAVSSLVVLRIIGLPVLGMVAKLLGVVALTPMGGLITSLSLIAGISYEIYEHWDAIASSISSIGSKIADLATTPRGGRMAALKRDAYEFMLSATSGSGAPPTSAAGGGAGAPVGGSAAPLVSAAPAAAALAGGGSALAPAPLTGNGVINVIVDFFNAPSGTRARVESGGSVSSQVRINHSMPSAVAP